MRVVILILLVFAAAPGPEAVSALGDLAGQHEPATPDAIDDAVIIAAVRVSPVEAAGLAAAQTSVGAGRRPDRPPLRPPIN